MTVSDTAEFKFKITGMDCASCAMTLEESVRQLDGVDNVQVNYTTTTMAGRGDAAAEAILKRIQSLGYDIADSDSPSQTAYENQYTGILGFIRYLLAKRQTSIALFAALLLLATLPLTFIPKPPALTLGIKILHMLVIVVVGYPIALKGVRSLMYAKRITIDLLMSIATVGAFLIDETGEAATVIMLFTLGEALEGYTAERSRDSLRGLLSLAPDEATVLESRNDSHQDETHYHEVLRPVEEIAVGEVVMIRPGERIPVDGNIRKGASLINQAPITGESIPVHKKEGDEVFAGTINGEGVLEVEMSRVAADSTITQIARLVEQAQSQRSPAERFIDRFAQWYTPLVVVLAILVAGIPPLLFGEPFFNTADGTYGWLYRGLALLIVACPCALVISTPVTVVSSLTALARRGVLIKGGAFLDALSRVKVFAFDKTGTLTEGRPVVTQSRSLTCPPEDARCPDCDDMLALATAVERRSEHPLAQAILSEARHRNLSDQYQAAESIKALAGRGIEGQLNGNTVTVGSHAFFHERYGEHAILHPLIVEAESLGQSVMLVAKDEQVLGFIAVADEPRETSRAALQSLHANHNNLQTVMLTGDHQKVAEAIAGRLGQIDDVRAGLLPEDKLNAIQQLKETYGAVAMVGDGINDAPALAAATVGIAMGGAGTAQAMETADVILMQDDLSRLPDAVATSRKTQRVIKQNIIFSLIIKVIFLMLVLPGWATLWMAVFADVGASLLVTLNGMRMLRQE